MQLGQLLDDLLNDARDPPADETRKDQTAAPAPAPSTDGAAPTPSVAGAALSALPQAGAGAMKVKILKCDNCKVAYEICLPGAGGGGSEGTTAAALPPTATPADAPAASPGSAEEGGGGGGVEPG